MEKHARKQIKHLLLQEDFTLKKLAECLSSKMGKKYSADSLSHKLRRSSVTYDEMVLIADILGYDIQFVRRENI